jgi:hypothetical protein
MIWLLILGVFVACLVVFIGWMAVDLFIFSRDNDDYTEDNQELSVYN